MRVYRKEHMFAEIELWGLEGYQGFGDFDHYRFSWWDKMRFEHFLGIKDWGL